MIDISPNNNKLAALAKESGIRFIIMHGSRADGSAHDESDVDIAVYLEPSRLEHFDFRAYGVILDGLEDALGSRGIGNIDLVILNTANILLRYDITTKGKLLYGDVLSYIQYGAFAYRDYIDAKPLFGLENDIILKRQALLRHHVTR